jgi:replicative DNA helicase
LPNARFPQPGGGAIRARLDPVAQRGVQPAAEVIDAADFYRDHRRIFDKMVKLSERNDAIDLVTLKEELGRSGDLDEVGGPAYITALVDGVPVR